MIRRNTTLIVGAGASCELQFPGNEELLARIGQNYDPARLGSDLQSKDNLLLAQYLQKMAGRLGQFVPCSHVLRQRLPRYRVNRVAWRCGRSSSVAFGVGRELDGLGRHVRWFLA